MRSRRLASLFLLPALLLATLPVMAKEVVGWLEMVHVHFNGQTMVMKAKIDSGAKTTSLGSNDYQTFLKHGRQWVRFKIKNHRNEELLIEKPILRMGKIKRHFGERQERPVITLGLCLGSLYRETEVNLVDRAGFNYPLLVGRRFLAGHFLIDSEIKYTSSGECRKRN